MKSIIQYFTCSTLLLAACSAPLPTPAGSSKPVATPTATPIPTPTPTAIPVATPTPTATPIPTPTPTAIPIATPTPTPTPVATATPVPTPTPLPTATPVAFSSLQLTVRDENSSMLDNAQVTVSSLDPVTVFEGKSTLKNNLHVVENVPVGINLKVTATAPGYNQRSMTHTLFGSAPGKLEFTGNLAISNKPEVIEFKPGYGRALELQEPIEFVFSESMDANSVERSFAVQANYTSQAFFKVGAQVPNPLSFVGRPSDSIYDVSHFKVEWITDRHLKLTPKYNWPISNNLNYRIIFNYLDSSGSGGGITDTDKNKARTPSISILESKEDGNLTKEDGPFFINNKYQPFIPFSVKDGNLKPPTVTTIAANNDVDGDKLTLTFSEALYYPLTSGITLVGGADSNRQSAAAGGYNSISAQDAAKNYQLTCNGTTVTMPASAIATFNTPEKILLQVVAPAQLFATGDSCILKIRTIRSTTGQTMDYEGEFRVP